ncbi:MAG: c-type cytochrome [Steroidobacteraceae bacterium]
MTMTGPRRWRARAVFALLALGAAGCALAMDDDAAKALLKSNGCTKCHAIDKDKKGPSYQKVAKDNKGKADAEAKIVKAITTGPKVKFADGSEEEHKKINSKDPAEVKALAQWILKQ